MSMVEWKKLGDFALVQKTKNKKHITENAYSITQAGLIPTKSFFKEKTNVTSKDTSGYYIVEKDWFVYSPSRIDVGSISYLKDEGPVIVSPIDVVFSIDKSICMPDYLLSYFFTYNGKKDLLRNIEGVEGMGRRNLPFDAIKNMQIPIPSLSEQNRIVGILDTFTSSIENLKEQIAQRRKQYEYYRDQLLDLEGKEGVEMKTLGEIAKYRRGSFPQPYGNREWYDGEGAMPFVQVADVEEYGRKLKERTKQYISTLAMPKSVYAPKGTVIVTLQGSIGKVAITQYDSYIDRTLGIFEGYRIDIDKIYFALQLEKIFSIKKEKARGGTIKTITKEEFTNFLIPVPSLIRQKLIVDILDKFEASIQNLEDQLSQREKQYEYYRNKLLTFE